MNLKLTDKKLKLFLLLGGIGIALIFLSTFFGGAGKEKEQPPKAETVQETALTNEQYQQKLEEKVGQLVKSIAGVGETNIMVTLESGVEYVYVTEENVNLDKTNSDEKTLAERRSTEEKTILVEDKDGRRQALLKTTLEPKVKGVVVVCQGGDDEVVKERVTEAIKTALHISSTRVCVTKLV